MKRTLLLLAIASIAISAKAQQQVPPAWDTAKTLADYVGSWEGAVCGVAAGGGPRFGRLEVVQTADSTVKVTYSFLRDDGTVGTAVSSPTISNGALEINFADPNGNRMSMALAYFQQYPNHIVGLTKFTGNGANVRQATSLFEPANLDLGAYARYHENICK